MDKKIIKACVRYKEKLYTGFDHGECLVKLQEDCKEINYEEIEQGFVDNDMIFVDRKKAMVIARNAGQLNYVTNKQTLISEDLHLSWLKDQSFEISKLKDEVEQAKERFVDHKRVDCQTMFALSDKIEELEERLSNCIEPKYKIGQDVWFIYDDDEYTILHKKVMAFNYNSYDGGHFTYAMSDDGTQETIWYGYINDKYVFATQEEAKAKVKELKHGVKS